jgi:single-strand DNA-binding protein
MSKIGVTGLVATTPRHLVTQDGLPITSFRLVSKEVRGGMNGEPSVEESNWYTITMFRRVAINAAGSISKGDRVVVYGNLSVRDWDNGERAGTSVEIVVDAIGHDMNYGTSTFVVVNVNNDTDKHDCNCGNCEKS